MTICGVHPPVFPQFSIIFPTNMAPYGAMVCFQPGVGPSRKVQIAAGSVPLARNRKMLPQSRGNPVSNHGVQGVNIWGERDDETWGFLNF